MAGKPGPKPGTVNNPKGINQYSTSGPKTRSIVGAKRVLEESNKNYQKAYDYATGNFLTLDRIADIPQKGVVKVLKQARRMEIAAGEDLKVMRRKHITADTKFVNYRIQTNGGKTPTPGGIF